MKKKRLTVTNAQMEFLKALGVEDRTYTKDEFDKIIDITADHLMAHGWKPGPDYEETNEIGDMCESIIDALVDGKHDDW